MGKVKKGEGIMRMKEEERGMTHVPQKNKPKGCRDSYRGAILKRER